ncbi:MAG: mechanosensitive ion channel family protein [Planctomycetota bacterium]|jgi:small-conductance mechanosensitive channel
MLDTLFSTFRACLPALITAAIVVTGLLAANWLLFHRRRDLKEENLFYGRIVMLLLTGLGIVLVLIALPLKETTESGLFTLLGLLLTAVIALSSTTFVANAMAGWMLRAVRSFKPGDFVRVGEHFGRVTGRRIFHTEIQIEDRDLTTLPNLYLISHPITVVRASGTIVSATVSLGYDNPHSVIEPLLTEAAKRAELEEPFVQIMELGDFSVTYRVAGFLSEVKQILTARSNLRAMMLDTLHDAKIEIVSPTFMYQRQTDGNARSVPPKTPSRRKSKVSAEDRIPEELIFDKAEQAERLEQLGVMRDKLTAEADEFEGQLKKADQAEQSQLERKIDRRRKRSEAIARIIETYQEDGDAPGKESQKRSKRKDTDSQ